MGYISRTAIDAILNGEETDLSEQSSYMSWLGRGCRMELHQDERDPDESELLSAGGQWGENLGNSLRVLVRQKEG